jgi:16S rRNA (guanine527-N7)-methyltransferase
MSTSASLGEIVEREMAGICRLDANQLSRLESHFRLMLVWNARVNLTRVTKLPEAATRHYCESLFLATLLTPGRVADIGSGAGFPGIPAAILRPECQFDLVESHQRKAVFLKEAVRGMSNVRVLAVRAESLAHGYEWVVSRAVDPREVVSLRIAPRLGLLLGESDALALRNADVRRLPWGDRRVVALLSGE